jgi:XTP/dITP diphosphohydrolase
VIPRLVVASKNRDKIGEIEAVLGELGLVGEIVRGLDWPHVDETGATLEENALLKARAVMETVGLPAVADDTGLEVAALGGAPGVETARYAGADASYSDNVRRLLRELEGVEQRDARFRTVVALVMPDGEEVVAEGVLDGFIAAAPRGNGGFGYDPVFEVDGITLSEMGVEKKNTLSHRAKALQSLAEMLGSRMT